MKNLKEMEFMSVEPKERQNGLRTDYLFKMRLPKSERKHGEIVVKFRMPGEVELPEKLTCLGGRETEVLACNVEDGNLVSVEFGTSTSPYSFLLQNVRNTNSFKTTSKFTQIIVSDNIDFENNGMAQFSKGFDITNNVAAKPTYSKLIMDSLIPNAFTKYRVAFYPSILSS